ncbi:glyoxalase [Actinosynnema sp. ALI-1.44]|uniref:VOC family protein n=1 Tax=Actinosynnema sp. ALI-1.44 TaxID=1933779 RepID=UPI00097CA23C|nr:VOC family protein [Actinosynnema sp. ALI-1.44]ONI71008.1 glyoxalase [Actinosynnema sp. ALI-1.44]
MTINRVVPDVRCADIGAAKQFYGRLGFEEVMNHGWVVAMASPTTPGAQVMLIEADPSGMHPVMSIEVDDVEAAHAAMLADGADIVYAIRDEPWGVRRFFVRDPDGQILNVVAHR